MHLLTHFIGLFFVSYFLKSIKKIQILHQGSHISLSYRPDVKEDGSIILWIATSS